MVLKGHCLCKAVTYTVDVDQPLITGYDHCDDCQRQSGSTYCKFHIYLDTNIWRIFGTPSPCGIWRGSLKVLVVVIAGRESTSPAPASPRTQMARSSYTTPVLKRELRPQGLHASTVQAPSASDWHVQWNESSQVPHAKLTLGCFKPGHGRAWTEQEETPNPPF